MTREVFADHRVYLDHNATSPLRPEAREAMMAALDCIGNPSSVHREGRAARAIVEGAREQVAGMFSVKPGAVYFTSGGTEAANWMLRPSTCDTKLIVSHVEHPCVLSGHGFAPGSVDAIPVTDDGIIDLDALEAALSPGAIVAIQAANNETGIIQPLAEIARLAGSKDVFLVCDAVQAAGRIPASDLAAAAAFFVSAHKFGGPEGAGAVVINDDAFPLHPLIRGGGQEKRQRAGTENVPAIAGLTAALEAAMLTQSELAGRTGQFRQKLEGGIRAIASDAIIFGEHARRLPNTTCFSIPGKSAETSLIAFDLAGIAVSSGSACSSGKVERSHVLNAMRAPQAISMGAIRVSSGWTTTEADIDRILSVLSKICSGRQDRYAA